MRPKTSSALYGRQALAAIVIGVLVLSVLGVAYASSHGATARAGSDQTVNENVLVTLDGTDSFSTFGINGISGYEWEQVTSDGSTTGVPSHLRVSIDNIYAGVTNFTSPYVAHNMTLYFWLYVEDRNNVEDQDWVAIKIHDTVNIDPVADAGDDQTVREGGIVALRGSGSDQDWGTTLSYEWEHVSGPSVTLSNPTSSQLTFTAPQVSSNSTIVLRLTVTDDDDATDSDTVNVKVTNAKLRATAPPYVNEGDTVTLRGTDESTGEITYQWFRYPHITLGMTGGDTLTPSFIAPEVDKDTRMTFVLLGIKGNTHNTATTFVTICDVSCTPEVDVGENTAMQEGTSLNLNPDVVDRNTADTLSYSWTHDWPGESSLPAQVVIQNPNSRYATFHAPDVRDTTVITIKLTVTDNHGKAGSDSREIVVKDNTPEEEGPTGVACGSTSTLRSFTFPQSHGGIYITGISVEDDIMYAMHHRSSGQTGVNEVRAFDISSGFTQVHHKTTQGPHSATDSDVVDIHMIDGQILTVDYDRTEVWDTTVGSSSGNRVSLEDFGDITSPGGIWSNTNKGYVMSHYLGISAHYKTIYGYGEITSGGTVSRIPANDINAHHPVRPVGLWSNGTHIWTADAARCTVIAYDTSTKQRVPALDINGTVSSPRGVAGDPDNRRMWVVSGGGTVKAYTFPTGSGATNAPPDPVTSSHDLIEGTSWSYQLPSAQKGHLVLSGDVPVGFTLDRNSRTVSWTPDDTGEWTVRVIGYGSGSNILSETILNLDVVANENPVIVFYVSAEQTITVGDTWADEGVVCEDDADEPKLLQADAAPNTAVAGVHTLTYTCTDSFGLKAVPAIRTLTVVDTTITPVTPSVNVTDSTPPVLSLNTGDSTVLQNDPFGDSGATCTDDTDPTRVVYADPPLDTSILGSHTLTYRCTDDAGNSADTLDRTVLVRAPPPVTTTNSTVPITPPSNSTMPVTPSPTNSTVPITPPSNSTIPVTPPPTNSTVPDTPPVTPPPNTPPVLLAIPNSTVAENSKVSFVVSASDDLEDTLTYSASGLPEGASFNEMTGAFEWKPSERQGPGIYHITFGVTDGTDAGQPRTATITVTESNRPPHIEGSAAEGYRCNTVMGDTVNATVTIIDPDLPIQDMVIQDGTGDIDYTADISGGTLTFGATIPDDPLELPYDYRFIFFLTISDGHDPPGTTNLSIFLYLPEAGESAWPGC